MRLQVCSAKPHSSTNSVEYDRPIAHPRVDRTFCHLAHNIYAVGSGNFTNGIRIYRFNKGSQTWTLVTNDGEENLAGAANQAWGSGADDLYVTGQRARTNVAAGSVIRYMDAESKNLPYRFYRARVE